MEPKVIFVLATVFTLALSAQAQGLAETCVMEPRQRQNCGFPGVTAAQCSAKGCCFDDTVLGFPWCFHPVHVDNPDTHTESPEDCPF